MGAGDLYSFIDYHFLHVAAQARYMSLCRCEVIIHRYYRSLFDKSHREDVLCSPSLMGWQEVFRAEYLLKLVCKASEGRAACIAIIRDHHRSKLPVAHGVDSAVCEHVKEDILVLQQECVVACLFYRLSPAFDRYEIQTLDYPDLMQLKRDVLTGIELYFRHVFPFSLSLGNASAHVK